MGGRVGLFGCSFLGLLLSCLCLPGAYLLYLSNQDDRFTPIVLGLSAVAVGFIMFMLLAATLIAPQAALGISEIVRQASRGITGNKVRAFFPVLGVTVSVTAVIVLVAIGQGMKNGIASQLGGIGRETLKVVPTTKQQIDNPPDKDDPMASVTFISAATPQFKASNLSNSALRQSDIDEIRKGRGSDFVADAAPIIQNSEFVKAAEGSSVKLRTTLLGTTGSYAAVLNWDVDSALANNRWFGDKAKDEAVVGSTVVKKLWPDIQRKDAIGRQIILEDQDGKSHRFKIVGVMAETERGVASAQDNKMFILIDAARDLYQGSTPGAPGQQARPIEYGDRIDEIDIKVKGGDKAQQITDAKAFVKSTLEKAKEKEPDQTRYFVVKDAEDISKPNEAIFQKMDSALGGIIFISLLEAGFLVLMIMYVSVKERTREIGVRKAMGATNAQVVGQFLTEAVLLCVVGGIVGVPLGLLSTFLINMTGFSAKLQIWSIPLAFFSVFIVGILSGLFPSQQAARIPPVEALRSE